MREQYIWLRLSSFLQSWGSESPGYSVRNTGTMPTFSGILGLLCSCIGLSFRRDLEEIKKLRDSLMMDIYIVSRGSYLKDFQGAGGGIPIGRNNHRTNYQEKCLPKGGSKRSQKIYSKEYIQDAKFDVVLRIKDPDTVKKLILGLNNPKWHIFLGRKANHLTEIPLGGVFADMENMQTQWNNEKRAHIGNYFLHVDQGAIGSYPVKDYPLCAGNNSTTYRYVKEMPCQ